MRQSKKKNNLKNLIKSYENILFEFFRSYINDHKLCELCIIPIDIRSIKGWDEEISFDVKSSLFKISKEAEFERKKLKNITDKITDITELIRLRDAGSSDTKQKYDDVIKLGVKDTDVQTEAQTEKTLERLKNEKKKIEEAITKKYTFKNNQEEFIPLLTLYCLGQAIMKMHRLFKPEFEKIVITDYRLTRDKVYPISINIIADDTTNSNVFKFYRNLLTIAENPKQDYIISTIPVIPRPIKE